MPHNLKKSEFYKNNKGIRKALNNRVMFDIAGK